MNSKQALEAYRRLCRHLDYDNDDYMFNGQYEEDNEVIENALKDYEILKKDLEVLESIKTKRVDISLIKNCYGPLAYAVYNSYIDEEKNDELTKQEFDLLKELLRNE